MKLKNKTILVTGGTGSFGSKFIYALLKTDIKKIIIFSRDEKKQEDMRFVINDDRVNYFLGDVREYNSMRSAFLGVDFVFHAAALKQVPSCEFFPMEAVKTNVLGAENVMNMCVQNNVKKCVLLSTDKAVLPFNAMGLSKALMEKVMLSKSRNVGHKGTIFIATRYGNVLGSRGSVLPLFINQIKNKKPLTITNPEMTRFMMTLDEAVALVFYALNNGKQGDIFVQKSPAAKLSDIILSLEHIYEKKLNIKMIGTRHGEKLYEDLVSNDELFRAKENKNYYQILMDDRNLKYENYLLKGAHVNNEETYNSHNTERLSVQQIIKLLKKSNVLND